MQFIPVANQLQNNSNGNKIVIESSASANLRHLEFSSIL
jgi:hypothetical protein